MDGLVLININPNAEGIIDSVANKVRCVRVGACVCWSQISMDIDINDI